MVTVKRGVDFISVKNPREALKAMHAISRNAEIPASKVADAVGFMGLSVKETVNVYAAFAYETRQAEVIAFTSGGKKRLYREVA